MIKKYITKKIFLILFLINPIYSSPCQNQNNRCAYRISRLHENEYLMIKNILTNLIEKHWEVTSNYLSFIFNSQLKECDQYIDYIAIKQVIQKDYRHPNSLFGKIPSNKVNHTIKLQYEIEWLDKYKMINYQLQSKKYTEQCNIIGLKLYYLIYEFAKNQKNIFKCSSSQEEPISNLIDYYIAQNFLKNCNGNLEMLANGIYKLLNYDCSRVYKFTIAYFNSNYLNLFRTCDPNLTVNDLINSGRFNNCSSKSLVFKKNDCSWYDIVCKYPEICLKSMKWKTD
jgi:hypothetical protein